MPCFFLISFFEGLLLYDASRENFTYVSGQKYTQVT